jgi:hypothetical protein
MTGGKRRTSEGRCDATLSRGARCHFAATHHHHTQAGDRLALCGVHLRTIKRRERLGSDEELTARWREWNPLEGSTPSPRS